MQQNTVIRCSRGTASEKCEDHDRDSKMRHTMRTLAPKACGGRLDLNFDLTTPLLPCGRVTRLHDHKHTGSAENTKTLPPDDANLRPCNFLLGPVYICYTLHERHGSTQRTREGKDSPSCVPFRGRIEHPPWSRHPQSEGGKCSGECCACHAYGRERALCCRVYIGEKSGGSVLD